MAEPLIPGSAELTEEERAAVERGDLPPQVTLADLHPDGISPELARSLVRLLRLRGVVQRRLDRSA